MTKTIHQKVKLPASPDRLYGIYMNSKKHAAAIGFKASIENKVGGRFSAFGMLKGKFLHLEKNKKIVQTWRSNIFKKKDSDSILILNLRKVRNGTEIDLVHAHVPDYEYKPVQKGWHHYYWNPWKKYLSRVKHRS